MKNPLIENCKHEATMLWMSKAKYARGYLLTYCLDCERTVNAEKIKEGKERVKHIKGVK